LVKKSGWLKKRRRLRKRRGGFVVDAAKHHGGFVNDLGCLFVDATLLGFQHYAKTHHLSFYSMLAFFVTL